MIIGLAAKKQHGKDTFADYMVQFHGFEKLSFARPMKQSAAAALGVSVETLEALKENPLARVQLVDLLGGDDLHDGNAVCQIHADISVREYLKFVGTQAHRHIPEFGEDVWVDMVEAKLAGGGNYVIPDARFANEQRLVKEYGGVVVHIFRPGMPDDDGHESEQVDHGLADFHIVNDGTLDDFCASIEESLGAMQALSR